MKRTKDIAYITIRDPIAFRKSILLSNVGVIRILEKYEMFKQIRNQKRGLVNEIREKMLSLHDDMLKIKSFLPDVNEKALDREYEEVKEKMQDVRSPSKRSPRKSQDSRNLQSELRMLQEKLSNLDI